MFSVSRLQYVFRVTPLFHEVSMLQVGRFNIKETPNCEILANASHVT